jgi:LssY-like putative type I secretion system component LssY
MAKQPTSKVSNDGDFTERLLELVTIPIAILATVYLLLAYIVLPALWTHHERQPQLAHRTMLTATRQGISGDPINVGFVGDREDIIRAMHEAGWFAANDVTLRSSVAIIGSVLLDRPYQTAPVSPLYYEGRPEDLAFELPDGVSAHRRHHVRIWRVLDVGLEGRPIWLGASTYDRGVGVSRYTGQVTHHIAPQIDQEREFLIGQLSKANMVETRYSVTGVGPTLIDRNGEGDLYQTDGEIWIVQLVVKGNRRTEPPAILDPPTLVQEKNTIWNTLMGVVGQ